MPDTTAINTRHATDCTVVPKYRVHPIRSRICGLSRLPWPPFEQPCALAHPTGIFKMNTTKDQKKVSNLVKLVRATIVGGLLVVLPAYLALILLDEVVRGLVAVLGGLIKPITTLLGIDADALGFTIGALVFLLLCAIAGILLKTSYSRVIKNRIEPIFRQIPGYVLLRSITNRVARLETAEKLDVGFVELIENQRSLSAAFVLEKHDSGSYTIFVPIVPTPTVGNIYVVPAHRLFIVDVPFMDMVKFITKWGESSPALREAISRLPV
jgi:uncharacterized membrane protein